MNMKTFSRAITLRSWIKGHPAIDQLGVTGPLCAFSVLHSVPQDALLNYLTMLEVCLKERGVVGAIKWNKTVRNCFTRWLAGDPLVGNTGVKMSKRVSGLPKILEGFGVEDRFDPFNRIILTLLLLTRAIPGGKDVGIESITSDYSGSWTPSLWDDRVFDHFRKRVTKTKVGFKPPVSDNPWILTTKNGPSGHAITTCYSELSLISPAIFDAMEVLLGQDTVNLIRKIRFILRNDECDELDEIKAIFGLVEVERPKLAKISTIPDKEGKSRNIALGTYWTQVALRPLHDWAIRALRGIPEDCTYDQQKSLRVLKKEAGHKFWSFDLSSATDRFPIEFQAKLIASYFGEAYCNSWKTLVSPTFHSKSGDIKYAVGQPIGFLSSWSIFSLAHHFVVYCAGRNAGISVRNKYVLLGDDIVIADDRLAEQYKQLIAELGVEISPLKTHVSYDTYEFAKRWYQSGKEISPFPLLAFGDLKYTSVLAAVLQSLERGWTTTDITIEQVCSFYTGISRGHYGPEYLERIEGMYTLYYSVYRAMKGYTSWTTVWNNLRFARRELKHMRSNFQNPVFGDHLYRLTIFAIYYTQGMGALVSKSTELRKRFSGTLFWDSELNILPASTEEGEFLNAFPQVRILERLKDHMLRAISNADTMTPEDYFKTLMGKNKEEPIGLLTSDLSTLFTQRNQPSGWTVLNSLVNRLVTYASKVSRSGMVFDVGSGGRLPYYLSVDILEPLLQYGDNVSADSRGDPVLSSYWEEVKDGTDGLYGDPVTPPWITELFDEEIKSHSAYYGSDLTFNWS